MQYQVEKWADCKDEMAALWPLHWEEVANDRDKIKLDVWHEAYDALAESGELHIVTARVDGKIVGYHWSIVRPHLHYKSSLTAYTDIYFLKSENRKGMAGINLFKFVEQSLKERGVQKMYTASKKKMDKSSIFEFLGWTEAEKVYCKYIGDE